MKFLVFLLLMFSFILVSTGILVVLTVTPLPSDKEISDREQIKFLDELKEKKE